MSNFGKKTIPASFVCTKSIVYVLNASGFLRCKNFMFQQNLFCASILETLWKSYGREFFDWTYHGSRCTDICVCVSCWATFQPYQPVKGTNPAMNML